MCSITGWGSWGGEGAPVSQKKPRRHLGSTPRKQARLPTQAHVIISEEYDQKARKHQVCGQYEIGRPVQILIHQTDEWFNGGFLK